MISEVCTALKVELEKIAINVFIYWKATANED